MWVVILLCSISADQCSLYNNISNLNSYTWHLYTSKKECNRDAQAAANKWSKRDKNHYTYYCQDTSSPSSSPYSSMAIPPIAVQPPPPPPPPPTREPAPPPSPSPPAGKTSEPASPPSTSLPAGKTSEPAHPPSTNLPAGDKQAPCPMAAEIKRLTEEGVLPSDIATRLGLSRADVYQCLP